MKYSYILSMLMTGATLLSCQSTDNALNSDDRVKTEVDINEVRVDTLRFKNFMREIISNGRLAADRRSVLSFKAQGVLSSVCFGNGERVKGGDVIARLDDSQARHELQQAELGVAKADIELRDVLIGLGYAADDTLSVPADIMRTAKIRSGFSDAHMALASARRNLEACLLRAPFSGKVADIKKQASEMSEAEFCTVLDDSRLSVEFSVLESEYSFLSKGQPVVVIPYGFGDKRMSGRITSINPRIDSKGQVAVTAEVANDGSLVDGMNARVIVRQDAGKRLVVPKSAVVIRDNMEVLFKIKNNGKAGWTYVDVEMANDSEYAVNANEERNAQLEEGDIVIVSGNLNLAEDSEVVIVK
ncbi:MAG: efflux RND transporter periplasmic adaptor subunit [Rikenellaceae bacterium]|nr:efflux RND transporter periplasmic adaptor subunit [Rikenellaceae bacterium]